MTGFSVKDPSRIGVAVLGAGRMGQTHVRNVASVPNANVVVVADPDPAASAAGRDLARARRASDDPLEAIHDPDVEAVVIVTPDRHPRLADRGRAARRQGRLEREADRAGDRRDVPDRRPLARDRDPGPAGVHAPVRPGLREGEADDRRRRARPDRAVPRPVEGHVPAARRVPALVRRLVPGHVLARPRPRPFPGRGGRRGPRVGERPVRRPLRAGRRLGHLGRRAQVPERRPRRRRDLAPLRVGLRHPHRGRGRPWARS